MTTVHGPTGPTLMMATLGAFGLTYLGLAAGRVPGSRIDRAGIAVVGAFAMLALGSLMPDQAARSVDYHTLILLFGMMIVAAFLKLSGGFALATERLAEWCSGPHRLLAAVIGLSGVLSALLVNDVVCVALTPLVLDACRRLNRRPLPYLIGLATASNVGSVATLTGNPQNMIIGSLSGISYLRFAAKLAPVALIGLVINFVVVAWVYRAQLAEAPETGPTTLERPRVHRGLLRVSLAVFLATVGLFFAGFPIDQVALGAAAVLLLVGGLRSERAYERVDWPLLIMFTGLFVVVHAFEVRVVRPYGLEHRDLLGRNPIATLSGLSAILSNLVSNVPAVLLFRPVIEPASHPEPLWLALAMSSTFAGNLTVLGSVANLIVVETARRSGIALGFVEYLKVGVPLTLLTLAMGVAWLMFVPY